MRHAQKASLCLVLGLAVAIGPLPAAAASQPSDADMENAQAAYEEGKKAYRLGRYDEAITKFEEAYELSGLSLILYNTGLAYKNRFDVSNDVADLRQAKALFKNFYAELARDPDLGDPAEIEGLLKDIDAAIEKWEADDEERRRLEAEAAAAKNRPEGPAQPVGPVGPDPGKTPRLIGIGLMGGGGGVTIAGAAIITAMALRGQEFQTEYDDSGGTDNVARDNGLKANRIALAVGVPVTVVGLGAVAAGAVVFVRAEKKTKAWEQGKKVSDLRVVPTLGGLSVSGRF